MLAPARGNLIIAHAEGLSIPRGLDTLERFREWTRSDSCPEKGRIDWICGDLEIDMSPEEGNTHGEPKASIASTLHSLVAGSDRGVVYIDAMRVVSPNADVSVEPDVVVLLYSTVEAGRVRMVPRASRKEGRFVELEGAPDLVVESVSDSSVKKDTVRLRERYFRAGIPEYWIADSRGDAPLLSILRRGEDAYEESPPDAEGFARSAVLGRDVRLVRLPPRAGLARHRLETR